MNILLVYPKYPDTFWSFKHALKFVYKKAAFPPLGLLTVASMLPEKWEKKLVDMNVTRLTDGDIPWADNVFISAMEVQKESVRQVITQCRQMGVKTIAGGPLFTTGYEEFSDINHMILGEADVSLQPFLEDLERDVVKSIYASSDRPHISTTPVPMWSLIDMKQYSSMNIQYSQGCHFDCEFCDIVLLNGHTPRAKTKEQIISGLDSLYEISWRGNIFIVDDNFIGNKKKLNAEILPAFIEWGKLKKYPFVFHTEVSINLADDEDLMRLMVAAGFNTVFVGIETPNIESLVECTKYQNQNRNLNASVKRLQQFGLEVQGGFIVGFDNDPESIFQTQIDFIQNSGIVTAMVGLLNAPTGTKLYKRLKSEGRLLKSFSGSNTDFSLNFIPRMDQNKLEIGYKHILDTIYALSEYYRRIKTFLQEYQPSRTKIGRLQSHHIEAFFKSIWILGVREKGRKHYWRLFASYLMKSPHKFARFILLAVCGYHFRKVAMS